MTVAGKIQNLLEAFSKSCNEFVFFNSSLAVSGIFHSILGRSLTNESNLEDESCDGFTDPQRL